MLYSRSISSRVSALNGLTRVSFITFYSRGWLAAAVIPNSV